MTKRQNVKINMYRKVSDHISLSEGILDSIPAFKNAWVSFKEILALILVEAGVQLLNRKGAAATKEEARELYTQELIIIVGALIAYGEATNNEEIKSAANFTISALRALSNNKFIATANNITALAQNNLDALKDYGIIKKNMDDLQQLRNQYDAFVGKPGEAKITKGTATKNLNTQIKKADTVLENSLDKLVRGYKKQNPDFVTGYKIARVIDDAAAPAKPKPPKKDA